jgi:hypothetical protein
LGEAVSGMLIDSGLNRSISREYSSVPRGDRRSAIIAKDRAEEGTNGIDGEFWPVPDLPASLHDLLFFAENRLG